MSTQPPSGPAKVKVRPQPPGQAKVKVKPGAGGPPPGQRPPAQPPQGGASDDGLWSWGKVIGIALALGVVTALLGVLGHRAFLDPDADTTGLIISGLILLVIGTLAGLGLRWGAWLVPATVLLMVGWRVLRTLDLTNQAQQLGATITFAFLGIVVGAVAHVVYKVIGGE